MRIFTDERVKKLFVIIFCIMAFFIIVSQLMVDFSLPLLMVSLLAMIGIAIACGWYFYRQNRMIEDAVNHINAYLDGDTDARIDCDWEGDLYKLFHAVNTLAAVLNAHAENELRSKEFLKNTISDISHQLKTPLAALNIYNGLLQGEAEENSTLKEFTALSEQELDRIEMLVQNLLKITRLDAGTILFKKSPETVSGIVHDVAMHFAYRAEHEQKEIILSGADDIMLVCDRDWIIEAIDNIVKNALDHTEKGASVSIKWKSSASAVQIMIKDNGSGIHPEDLHHIFKRFYRSRFSKDIQGIGLGLPLVKAIVEAHNGTIEVDSMPGVGTSFVLNFLFPTKL